MLELIHAWTTAGGPPGFRTVSRSPDMSDATAELLITRSGLDVCYPGVASPVIAHRTLHMDGGLMSVLTRITQTPGPVPERPGRIAHHIVLTPDQRPDYGPVDLLTRASFLTSFTEAGKVTQFQLPKSVEPADTIRIDDAWIDLICRRLASRHCTTILTPPTLRCDQVLASIAAAMPDLGWLMTFVLGTDQHPDTTLLRVVEIGSTAADRLSIAGEGLIFSLADTPPQHPTTSSSEAGSSEADQPTPLRLESAPGIPTAMLVLGGIAIIAVVIAITTLGGWLQ
ncbi:MAG: hypothetical protein P8I91_07055 [Phycisphaerales bacterium]|nr:hypothetical protein [Phycisphaerales bacterium]